MIPGVWTIKNPDGDVHRIKVFDGHPCGYNAGWYWKPKDDEKGTPIGPFDSPGEAVADAKATIDQIDNGLDQDVQRDARGA